MKQLSLPITLALVVALTAGCSDELTPTAALQDEATPVALSKNGPPASSGPIVIRYESTFNYGIYDAKSDLTAWFGINVFAACSGAEPFEFDVMSYKDIDNPKAAERLNRMVKGDDVRAEVFQGQAFTCGAIAATGGPLAAGTADLVYTDNDFFAYLYEPGNRNAFGLNAHGTLESASGDRMRLNAHSRCTFEGMGGDSKCNDKVNLR